MKPTLAASAVALALAGIAAPAGAAGLGRLNVMSGLGQPLRAEVEVSATAEELSSLSARVAPADAFRQAGIDFAPALAGVKVAVSKRTDGKAVLRISSDRPVDDPFLAMLIELNWAAGRLLREYTFLLDPPESLVARRPVQAAAAPLAAPTVRPVETAPATEPSAAAPKEVPGSREVRRGDTLNRIANETKHDGVTLDQMLVAIFRANQGAFEGNMNRLKAGKILNIPDREAVVAVAQPDAKRIVIAQRADFAVYREKLAAAAAAAPAAREAPAQQEVAGKITPKIEERVPEPAEAKDQLRVSKAEAAGKEPGKEVAKVDRAAQARITALEEDLVAKEKALKESGTRLADLEKSVKELQQLLEMKNQNLAQLQQAAGAAKPPAPVVPAAPPAAEAPKPTPVEPPKAAGAPVKPAEAPQPAPAPVAPPPPPAPERSFLGELFSGPVGWLGGAAILAVLGWFGLRARKQRGEQVSPTVAAASTAPSVSVMGTAGGQAVDTTASSIQTDFSQSGLTAIDTEEGVDPVAEADVYMAYGRDAQAEEILLDALKNEPTRHAIHVKLLEIYAQRKSVKQFDGMANELYAQSGGAGPEWEKAAAMGRKLEPGNPLFGAVAEAPAEETRFTEKTIVVSSPEKLRDTWTMPGEISQIVSAVEGGAAAGPDKTVVLPESPLLQPAIGEAPGKAGIDFDLGAAAPAAETKPSEKPLDFDLGLDFSGTLGRPRAAATLGGETTVSLEKGAALKKPASAVDLPLDLEAQGEEVGGAAAAGNVIDFDLGQPGKPAREAGMIDLEATDVGGAILDINFDKLEEAKPRPATPAQVMDLERTDIGANLVQFGPEARQEPTSAPVVDLEKTDVGGGVLDFDFELEDRGARPTEKRAPPPAPEAPPTLDLSSIDLDLSAPPVEEESQDVVTKLELAKAYEDMGDKDGARELLDEVMKEGNPAQRQRAQEMLSRLG